MNSCVQNLQEWCNQIGTDLVAPSFFATGSAPFNGAKSLLQLSCVPATLPGTEDCVLESLERSEKGHKLVMPGPPATLPGTEDSVLESPERSKKGHKVVMPGPPNI